MENYICSYGISFSWKISFFLFLQDRVKQDRMCSNTFLLPLENLINSYREIMSEKHRLLDIHVCSFDIQISLKIGMGINL